MPSEDPIDLSLLPATAAASHAGTSIGGVPLDDIVAEHGTPIFVFDTHDMRTRFSEALSAFGPGTAYAVKAFMCGRLVTLANEVGLSLDVSTPGEYITARRFGYTPDRLVVHGNNKSPAFVDMAVRESAQWIVLDNDLDVELVADAARKHGVRPKVLVRINPGVEVHTHRYISTGNRGSKFGFPAWQDDAASALQRVMHDDRLDFAGIHMHIGSMVFSVDNFAHALASVGHLIEQCDPRNVVVGGGLGVRYLKEDDAPSLTTWAKTAVDTLRTMGYQGRVLAEPGRSLVASTAVTVYRVGRVKHDLDLGATIVAVDGGMGDNPRPMIYDSGYEVFSCAAPLSPRPAKVRIVGSHCESGDTLVYDGRLPEGVAVGDLVSTPVTGGYGYVMASTYNRIPKPPIVFVENGNVEVAVRRETIDDLFSLDTTPRQDLS